MIGTNAQTGEPLSGIDHLRQSIADILTTPIGSRIMRRDYGSHAFQLIDQAANDLGQVLLKAVCADAIAKWEPRFRLTRIAVADVSMSGRVAIDIEGEYVETGERLDLLGLDLLPATVSQPPLPVQPNPIEALVGRVVAHFKTKAYRLLGVDVEPEDILTALPVDEPTILGLNTKPREQNLLHYPDISNPLGWVVTAGNGSIILTPGQLDSKGTFTATRVQIDATYPGSFPRVTGIATDVSTTENSNIAFRVKSFDGSPQKVGIYDTRYGNPLRDVEADWHYIYSTNLATLSTIYPGLSLRHGVHGDENGGTLTCDILVEPVAQVENGDLPSFVPVETFGAPITREAEVPSLRPAYFYGPNLYTGQVFGTTPGVDQTETHLTYDGTQSDSTLTVRVNSLANPPLVEGDVVEIEYLIEGYVQGEVGLQLSHNPTPPIIDEMRSSNGEQVAVFASGPSQPNRLLFQTDNAFIGTIPKSSIVVRQRKTLPFVGATLEETSLSFSVGINAVPVDGKDRTVQRIGSDETDSYVLLWREGATGLYRLESFVAGVSQGYVAVAGLDDGEAHTLSCVIDYATGSLSLDADGQGLEGPELVVNGSFEAGDGTGWTDTGNYIGADFSSNGFVVLHRDGATLDKIDQHVAAKAGERLIVNAAAFDNASLWIGSAIGVSDYVQSTIAAPFSETIIPATDELFVRLQCGDDGDKSVDLVSIRASYTLDGVTLPDRAASMDQGHNAGIDQLDGQIEWVAVQ